jgi:hypothetical protein
MTSKTKAIHSFEISEAVYQLTRPEPQMFGIFIKTAVISSEYFISISRQKKKQENSVAMVGLRSFRINTNFYHVP